VTQKKSILRTTLVVLPAQVVFRGIEALLPLLLVYWFGRNHATDVYNFVFAVFTFAASLLFTAFQDSALVPILAEEKLARPHELPRLLGSLLGHAWAIGSALALLVGGIAFASFALRFDAPSFALAGKMVVPFSLFLVATTSRTFFGAVLTVEHHYFIQPIASALGMVANLALLATWHAGVGVPLIPVGALAGEVVATALLAWFAVRAVGVKVELTLARPPALLRFAKLVGAEVAGASVTRINPVVDQFMAGLAGVVGGGTILRYSGDIATLPTSLLQTALLPVLLSHLAEDFAHKKLDQIRQTVVRALLSVGGLLVAITAVLWLVRAPLLRFVFLRGQMDAAGVDRMIHIFPYHLVGLAPFGALLVLARAHIALKNSPIMLSMGLFNATCNAVFNVVLLRAIGLEGIALSTSCVQAAVAIVFWFRLESKIASLRASPPEAAT
jgi:putative peptidoglycan lipid II flippase